MKKILILICTFIIVICVDSVLIYHMEASEKMIDNSIKTVVLRLKEMQEFFTKYDIGNYGVMEVSANYRGAHGENYPSDFTYNYELSDKLYLEDPLSKEYRAINIDKNIINLFSNLNELKNINYLNPEMIIYSKQKRMNRIIIECDTSYLNEFFNTNFNKIDITIYTKGIFKKYDYTVITIDDISIKLLDNTIDIDYLNNNIKVDLYDNSYHININELFKANIIVTNSYSCSISIKDKIYYAEVKDDELYIKFNSQAAMYNSITILAKYEDVELEKTKELENIKNNPIANYVEASDYNIWR